MHGLITRRMGGKIKESEKAEAFQLIEQTIADPETCKQVFSTYYSLDSTFYYLPLIYSEKIAAEILANRFQFQRLITDIFALDRNWPPTIDRAFIEKIFDDPIEYKRLFNERVIIYILHEFPAKEVEIILNRIWHDADEFERFFHDNFQAMLDLAYLKAEIAKQLIDHWDFARLNESLYMTALVAPHILAALLPLGLNPNAYLDNNQNLLARLLEGKITKKRMDCALSLIQHGIDIQLPTTMLSAISKIYPNIKNYLQNHGIPEQCIADTRYVFANINICDLRIEINLQTPAKKNRNEYLTLLFILANDRKNPQSSSAIKPLPLDVILSILSFMNFNQMAKTYQQGVEVARFILSNAPTIKTMAAMPGGINVLVKKYASKNNKYHFFKSALRLSREFTELRKKLTTKKNMPKNPSDLWCAKEQREVAIDQLNKMRNEYGLMFFQQQAQLLSVSRQRLLKDRLIETELYKPLAEKL